MYPKVYDGIYGAITPLGGSLVDRRTNMKRSVDTFCVFNVNLLLRQVIQILGGARKQDIKDHR